MNQYLKRGGFCSEFTDFADVGALDEGKIILKASDKKWCSKVNGVSEVKSQLRSNHSRAKD